MARWEELRDAVVKIRDDSAKLVDKLFPPLPGSKHWDPLPDPLPKNVTGLPKLLLDPVDYQIIETDPLQLVQQLSSGKITAVAVAGAYLRAAIISQRATNSVVEFLPQLAHDRAVELDKALASPGGGPVGPLHGLPISVKALLNFKGHIHHKGIAKQTDSVADEDAQIIRLLRAAGANFYIRTTQPQILMHIEGDSLVNGVTLNPFNRDLTSGGSSAGEGAALGIHASSLGIGTDIGGSIRWPAAIQGQYGFKPTSSRLPASGAVHFMYGAEAIPAATGPMARTLEAATLFTRVLIEAEPWREDPSLNAIRWVNEPLKGKKKIRIGYYTDDGVVRPHPPVIRAIDEVVAKLKASAGKSVEGFELELVPFEPYKTEHSWLTLSGLYFEDGGNDIRSQLAETGEPHLPLTDWIFSIEGCKELTIAELWERNHQKSLFRQEYADYWHKQGIDVLICPVGPSAASLHGTSKYWDYTAHWNLLDYPALTVPVTAVSIEKDPANTSYVPRNDKDKFMHDLYAPEKYVDAPVSYQLVGMRSDDETVLEVARLIETVTRAA